MIEIHLTDLVDTPSVTTSTDGTTRLTMSWHTGIDQALDAAPQHISSSVKEDLRSLFASREIQREFEMINGTLVIRPPGIIELFETDS